MFGNPSWFRPKRWGWGLRPVTWQGWAYAFAWCGILVVPFLLLLNRGQVFEAVLWMVISMGALFWDVKHILAAYRTPTPPQSPGGSESREDDCEIRFLDDDAHSEPCRTWFSRHFHFCLRR